MQRWREPQLRRLVIGGFALRVLIMLISDGSNDMSTWTRFAFDIQSHGLLEQYVVEPDFNHPPLMGLWALLTLTIAIALHLSFAFLFKLVPLAADVLVAWVVFQVWRRRADSLFAWRACAAYAWAFLPVLITAFHGNTDTACAAFVLLSAFLLVERRAALLAGLAFAAALNVKLIPLVVLPALVLQLSWKQLWRFAVGFGAGLLPFVPVVLSVWSAFSERVLHYNGQATRWGLHFLMQSLARIPALHDGVNVVDAWYFQNGRYVLMAASGVIGLVARYRGTSVDRVVAVTLATFLVLTPAFGVQYAMIVVPVLFAVDAVRGSAYALISGAFVVSNYGHFLERVFPLHSTFTTDFPIGNAVIGLLAWALLIEFLVRGGRPLEVGGAHDSGTPAAVVDGDVDVGSRAVDG